MDNLIDFEPYRSSSKRKAKRADADDAAQVDNIILFTGVRFEYENTENLPDDPSNAKRRKLGDG